MKKIYQDITFYVIIFIITYFIYVYPFEILNILIFSEDTTRQSSLYYTLVIGVLIIFYFKSKNTFLPLKIFIYEGMGIGFISFWIVNIFLIIYYFDFYNSYYLGILSIILILICFIYGSINGRIIKINNIQIKSNKITKKYNFIFISDIHLGSNTLFHLKKIVKKIHLIKHDAIFIGGDLIDSSSFNIDKLSVFKEFKKPIYFVTGNHEYYISNYKEKLKNFNKYNINILNNEKLILDEINIIGISDNQKTEDQLILAKKFNNNLKFNIILVHKPSIWKFIKKKNDLMLSGHTHNGQIFPFNFFVKLQFRYNYGLYKNNHHYLYVSSGSGCWGPKMRVGTSNEIVNIKLEPYRN